MRLNCHSTKLRKPIYSALVSFIKRERKCKFGAGVMSAQKSFLLLKNAANYRLFFWVKNFHTKFIIINWISLLLLARQKFACSPCWFCRLRHQTMRRWGTLVTTFWDSPLTWSSESSGMYCRVLNWMSTDVSEVRAIALMMEAARPTDPSDNNQLRTRQYIPEDSELHTRRRENVKSHIVL
jgi:hypothetical protein